MNKSFFKTSAPVGLVLLSLMSAPAQADDNLGEVTVIGCGFSCQSARTRALQKQFQELMENVASAYAARDRGFSMYMVESAATASQQTKTPDLRCNSLASSVVGSTSASSTVSEQKAAAEAAWNVIKNQLTPQQFTTFVNGLPRPGGTTIFGSSIGTTPVVTIIWSNGTQTNFTVVTNNSGPSIGTSTGTAPKPPGETSACPG